MESIKNNTRLFYHLSYNIIIVRKALASIFQEA